jgi:ribosome-associated toxin RatA of RatAB toxin-antitoxin module
MKRIERTAIVEHSAGEMYALVDAVEAYPEFLPWCAGAEVHERSPGKTRATLTARIGALRQSFTTENQNQPGEAISMRLVKGPFRRFRGEWTFVPLGESACRIAFALEYEFASRTLGRMLAPLFDGMADSMVEAFVRRADEVHED